MTAIPVHVVETIDHLDYAYVPPCELPSCHDDHPAAVALLVPPARCAGCGHPIPTYYVCRPCIDRIIARGAKCWRCSAPVPRAGLKVRWIG